MKKRALTTLLAFLLILATLLCGCERDSATADPTGTVSLTETQSPTEPANITEPTTEPSPEVTMIPAETVVRYPSSDFPYGVITLKDGDMVLLYDSGCDFDRYLGKEDDTYSTHVYSAHILSRTPVEMSSVSIAAQGLDTASTYVRNNTDQIYAGEQYDATYVRATMMGIDWNRAMELYIPWAKAQAQYEQTGAIEDYQAQYAAQETYETYMESYGIYQNTTGPELERIYYAYEVMLLVGELEEDVTINAVEVTIGEESFSLPVGEIRLHRESLEETFEVIDGKAALAPYTVYYYYWYPQLDDLAGELIGMLDAKVFGNVMLEKLEIAGDSGTTIAEIRIGQESAYDYLSSVWLGETPFYLNDGDNVSMEIHVHDPRIIGNPLYHGAVQCLLTYSHAGGNVVHPIEIVITQNPMYLPLCAIHLDQVDLSGYWAYEALLEAEWTVG